MYINIFCIFMPFCNTCNLNLWDELEYNRFKLFLDITNYHYKGNISFKHQFYKPQLQWHDSPYQLMCHQKATHYSGRQKREILCLLYKHQSCTSTKGQRSFTGFLFMTFSIPSCAKMIITQRNHTGWNIMKLLPAVILRSHLLVISHNLLCPQREL
jgi:hypothetical protein